MNKLTYIIRTFWHYRRANFLVALGVAISTMVLAGSLIIGDSVRHSLTQATFYRLGATSHVLSAKERYFRQEMSAEIEAINPDVKATSVLLLDGIVVADGGQQRANNVQVIGVGPDFADISDQPLWNDLDKEIAISENLAKKLGKGEGDPVLVRVAKASLIPLNAPFVAADEGSVAYRATIGKVLAKEEMGRFNLKNSQTAPYNLFMSINRLNTLMEFERKANHILFSIGRDDIPVEGLVDKCLTPEDASLTINSIDHSNQVEITSERVFIGGKLSEVLNGLPGAEPVLTYFVNQMSRQDNKDSKAGDSNAIPYSFVTGWDNSGAGPDEVLLNRWAADDLGVQVGEKIAFKYFEIGPLRKLVEKKRTLVLKGIVPMDEKWADPGLAPHLPGLSDAGHCREWETGVPIDLDAIRDKDEDYWDEYKGSPKAFISVNMAKEMWANRFGDYTSFRYNEAEFDKEAFLKIFGTEILAHDLGMQVEPVREQGIQAAQNGTDFSGLFLGLSFFILVGAVLLSGLLFRLNLESRSLQVGVLTALGFRPKQIRYIHLSEGLVLALIGGVLGLFLSVYYTRLIFWVLNTLWFEIVRTTVLQIKILPGTLFVSYAIGVIISLLAMLLSLRRFQKKKLSDLKSGVVKEGRILPNIVYRVIMFILLISAIGLLVYQLLSSQELDSALFFLSGGLLLPGLLMLFRKSLQVKRKETEWLSISRLSVLNRSRNKGRSMTLVILFALGTFLVVSTGANRLDLFADAGEKYSGTGGFMYLATSSIPVLYDINDEQKRGEEGFYEDFSVVQFRSVDGDDASCLNLNRIAQPTLLGVDPDALKERFSFVVNQFEGYEDPWMALGEELEDGTIPAIADQTVIQWGLGKKIGDILLYQNEMGDTLRIKLVAGTKPSIFQGYLIISNEHFIRNFPTSSGSDLFLVEGDPSDEVAIGEELSSVFRDFGWEMQNTSVRLNEFYSVTNTYLSIFLALGTLGMLLGTIGLAVILARSILERRRELAVMQATGFRDSQIIRTLVVEYVNLLLWGVLIGFISAGVATLPSLLSTNTDVSFDTIFVAVGLILLNGVIWIYGLSWGMVRKRVLVAEIREN